MNTTEITKISAKEYFILELLSKNSEMYGMKMVEASNGELKVGTIYPTLQRMEEKGLIGSREVQRDLPETGNPRRFYKITEYGIRVFDKNMALSSLFRSKLLTIDGAAELMFVSKSTVFSWVEAGEVESVEGPDGDTLISHDQLLSERTKSYFDEGRKWELMNLERAIEHGKHWFEKAIESNPRYGAAYHELGRMYYTWHHYYDALEPLKKAYEMNRDAMQPAFNLGMTYAGMQRHVEAVDCLRNVVQISPNHALGWQGLGIELSFLGFHNEENAKEAIEALKKAFELDRKSQKTIWFLSRLYVLQTYGILDFDSAKLLAEEVADDFPHFKEEIELLIELNSRSLRKNA